MKNLFLIALLALSSLSFADEAAEEACVPTTEVPCEVEEEAAE